MSLMHVFRVALLATALFGCHNANRAPRVVAPSIPADTAARDALRPQGDSLMRVPEPGLGDNGSVTLGRISILSNRIDEYARQRGVLPSQLDDLNSIDPSAAAVFQDGWGASVQYRTRAETYEIRSSGPDQAFNSADDIVLIGAAGKPCSLSPGDGRTVVFSSEGRCSVSKAAPR